MKIHLFFVSAIIFGSVSLHADSLAGSVAGVVRDQAKSPVAGTAITLTKLDDKTTKATVSAADGSWVLATEPGVYSLTAGKPGYTEFTLASLRVGEGQAAKADIALVSAAPAPPPPANVAKGFWKRLGQAYWDDWHPPAVAAVVPPAPGAEPEYRGDPPPFTNPPYPFSVWPMGARYGLGTTIRLNIR